jgi:hypothetical protein
MLMGYQSTRNRANTGAAGPSGVRSSEPSGGYGARESYCGTLTPDGAPYPPYDKGTA